MLAPNILLQNRYLVLRPVGRGGMGTVYEAQDTRLHATVALKQTLMTDNASLRAFEREAQLLARLRHPVLPKVIDHFTEREGQFLVMEFIAGDDLATLMEKQGGHFPMAAVLPWVLRWGDQLLDALDYLHRQSPPIYHRDIKPQNLKLTPRGDIILLDFGLAKGGMAEASTLTARGEKLMGFTPNYAPLEQIRGSDPDPRSDLYSLAATLYHLGAGSKPPDALTRVAALLNDQEDPLRPANDYNNHITPAVAAVLLRAMAPNLEDRYTSAAEMRKALAAARSGRDTSTPAATMAGPGTTSLRMLSRSSLSSPSQPFVAASTLIANQQHHDDNTLFPAASLGQVPAGTMLQTLQTGSPVLCIALSPDGRLLAVGSEDNSISLWDLTSGDLVQTLYEHTRSVSCVSFSPDGEMLVSGSEDSSLCLWSVRDNSLLYKYEHGDPIECACFSPDRHLLAYGGWSDAVFLCPVQEATILDPVELPTSFVHSLAFSPDGCTLVAGCYDTTVRFWRVSDRNPLHALSGHTNFVLTTAFSPNGKTVASGGGETNILLWRVQDGRLIDTLKGHTNFVRSLAFSASGNILASGSEDKTVRLWQTSDGLHLHTFEGHTDGVTCVAFSPDGKVLISGSRDTKIRLWQAQ